MFREKLGYGWSGFALRLLLALIYIVICSVASRLLVGPQPAFSQPVRLIAAVSALLPLLVFVLAQTVLQRRQDEYEQALTAQARAWAAQTAVLWGLLLVVAAQVVPVVQAPGIVTLAGFFVFVSVLMRQVLKFRRVKS